MSNKIGIKLDHSLYNGGLKDGVRIECERNPTGRWGVTVGIDTPCHQGKDTPRSFENGSPYFNYLWCLWNTDGYRDVSGRAFNNVERNYVLSESTAIVQDVFDCNSIGSHKLTCTCPIRELMQFGCLCGHAATEIAYEKKKRS